MKYFNPGKKPKKFGNDKKWRSAASSKIGRKRYRQYEQAAFLGFTSPVRRRTKINPLKIKAIVLSLVLMSWFIFLIFFPYFRIVNISIKGLNILQKNDVLNIINSSLKPESKILPFNHYFFVNTDKIKFNLLNDLPIADIFIEKKFPNSLNVTINEKNSSIILDNEESYYLLDQEGLRLRYLGKVGDNEYLSTTNTIFTATTTSTTSTFSIVHVPNNEIVKNEFPNLPIVLYNSSNKSLNPKKNTIGFINDVDAGLKKGSGPKTTYYELSNDEGTVRVFSNLKWQIIFSTERPVEDQLTTFWNVYKSSRPLEYIDVRIEDRIFWK